MNRLLSSTIVAVVAALLLTGCGGDDSSRDGGADFNDADVTFAQSMVPHHQQAVEMSKLARQRASAPEVKKLAARIESAQGPEITTMQGWLEDWGKDESSMDGMDHGSDGSGMEDMPGMMSDDELGELGQSTATGFDQMFLAMMIEHHTGAIEMARTEQAEGKNAEAKALAKKIRADQTTEIAEMKKLQGP